MKVERVARWAEVAANIGVIVTLVLLVGEVRSNTASLQRQAILERARIINEPFLTESQIPAILSKVKAVDGIEELEAAYMERYGLSHEEAAIWARYEGIIWTGWEADYSLLGDDPIVRERIEVFLERYPDVRLWWEIAGPLVLGPEFRAYVEEIQQGR